jgi:hypothetical protein
MRHRHRQLRLRPLRAAVTIAIAASATIAVDSARAATVGNFSYGELQASTLGATGCGANAAGEPAIHVSRADNVFLGSENGLLGGSQFWRGLGAVGGSSASACALEYRGQPNVLAGGVGLSGGDIDIALASAKNASGNYNVYVASLNLASVNVAHSNDNGATNAW